MANQHVKIVVVKADGTELVMWHSTLTNPALDCVTHIAQLLEKVCQYPNSSSIIEELTDILDKAYKEALL